MIDNVIMINNKNKIHEPPATTKFITQGGTNLK